MDKYDDVRCFRCKRPESYTWTRRGHCCRDCYAKLARSKDPTDWRKIES